MTEIERLAREYEDEIIRIRHDLHRIPELSFKEYKTASYIRQRLDALRIPYTAVCGTGIVAVINGSRPGRTVLLRADIDALPIEEESGVEFSSEHKGMMHACGHDIHAACLLGAAMILWRIKDRLAGTVKLVFQPGEEEDGGALPMIEEGILNDPPVDAAFALHVEPLEKCGNIQYKNGAIMASPDDFEIILRGKGGHGASPQTAKNPINGAAAIVNALGMLSASAFDPMTPHVITICSVNAGFCRNVIPENAVITGTARTIDPQTRKRIAELIKDCAQKTAASLGVAAEVNYNWLFPPVINDRAMNERLKEACGKLDCVKHMRELEKASMAGDDFAYFGERVPSCYFKLGVGGSGENFPIHSPHFWADEASFKIGAAVLAQLAADFLKLA